MPNRPAKRHLLRTYFIRNYLAFILFRRLPLVPLDTAAVMQHLILVITSDTAIAHLAGALGVRVWVAVAGSADWRWLSDREESPWYPTMRLFRQKVWGCWKEVFQRISAEIVAQCV